MLYLVPSELPNNGGGDIYVEAEYTTGAINLEAPAESWFMATDLYQGWYVYCSGNTARNIQVYCMGGTEESIKNFYSDYYDLPPDYAIEKLKNDMYDKYEINMPPYLPRGAVLDTFTPPIENQFKQWFQDEILGTASTRKTLHNQMDVSFLTTVKPVLEIIREDGVYGDFYESTTIPDLMDGQYWGFYIKVEDNLIPDWNLDHDHAVVVVSWLEETGMFDEDGIPILVQQTSAPLPISMRTNTGGLYNFHTKEMDMLYSNYPEYFINYQEIEEEDRY